jgi:hypothetical protein
MKGCLDDAEALCSPGALGLVSCDEDAEVQLRQRRGADRGFEVVRAVFGNQHRRVE